MKFFILLALFAIIATALALPAPDVPEDEGVEFVDVALTADDIPKPQPRLSCQLLGPLGCNAHCRTKGFRGGWCTTGQTCRCFR